jgi:hypothetical protein
MRPFERFLVRLDDWPWSAIVRVAMGLCVPLFSNALFGESVSVWVFPAFFVGVLIALRVAPALIRAAVPFSAEAKAIWVERRALAKRYDSYQSQKLFWIGLGLLLYVAITADTQVGAVLVTATSLIGGGAGLLIWLKIDDKRSPPQT